MIKANLVPVLTVLDCLESGVHTRLFRRSTPLTDVLVDTYLTNFDYLQNEQLQNAFLTYSSKNSHVYMEWL